MRLAAFLILLVLSTIPASADDRQKAERQIRKITAMATDKTGRRMVSIRMADLFKMPRPALVEQRRWLGLDYGSLLLAHSLQENGMPVADLASCLKSGKTVWQIADEHHTNWGRIAADAKKMNALIDDSIYRHFLSKKNYEADQQRDLDDKYDPVRDGVRTDFDVTPKEMVDAQARYEFWRDQAGLLPSGRGRMNSHDALAAEIDRSSEIHSTEGTSAPPAGGLPSH